MTKKKMVCSTCGIEAIETKPGFGFYKHKDTSIEEIEDIEVRIHIQYWDDTRFHIFVEEEEEYKIRQVLKKL